MCHLIIVGLRHQLRTQTRDFLINRMKKISTKKEITPPNLIGNNNCIYDREIDKLPKGLILDGDELFKLNHFDAIWEIAEQFQIIIKKYQSGIETISELDRKMREEYYKMRNEKNSLEDTLESVKKEFEEKTKLLNNELLHIKNLRRTYPIELIEKANEIYNNQSGRKPHKTLSDSCIKANEELGIFSKELLMDEYGHYTEFLINQGDRVSRKTSKNIRTGLTDLTSQCREDINTAKTMGRKMYSPIGRARAASPKKKAERQIYLNEISSDFSESDLDINFDRK